MNKHSKINIHLKTFRAATCEDMLSYVQHQLLIEQNLMELLLMWELMMCQRKEKDLMILIQLYRLVKSVETQV